jgi:hypothetical protein
VAKVEETGNAHRIFVGRSIISEVSENVGYSFKRDHRKVGFENGRWMEIAQDVLKSEFWC